MNFTRAIVTLALIATPLAISACKKEAPPPPAAAATPAPPPPPQPAVTKIELGSSAGADGRVLATRSTFGVKDSIIASVYTENAAPGSTLTAKWTFQTGQTVDSTSQAVGTGGVTEFHIVKKSGWPIGKYKVSIALNGTPATSADFDVMKK
jgi:hypothetical protein